MKLSKDLIRSICDNAEYCADYEIDGLGEGDIPNAKNIAWNIGEDLQKLEIDPSDIEEGILLDKDRARNLANAFTELLQGTDNLSKNAVKEVEDFLDDVENLLFLIGD